MSVCATCYQPGIGDHAQHDCRALRDIVLAGHPDHRITLDAAPARARIAFRVLTDHSRDITIQSNGHIDIADQALYRIVGYAPGHASLIVELVEDWRPGSAPAEESPAGQQEQTAPVDWESIARDRERELKLVGEARHRAEAEVDRLRAGEEPGWDKLTVPTSGQWIASWNQASAAERLDVATRVIENAQKAGECFEMNHVRRLEEDRQAWVTVARVRELRDTWLRMTLEPGQVRRLLDGITHALDGREETGAPRPASGFVPAAVPKHIPRTGDPAHTLVVEPYRNDRNQDRWVFRSWGTATCAGWLSLDHYSQESAERAQKRHVAEEHGAEPGEALPWWELGTSGLLWLINRIVFHPRGLALGFHAEDGVPYGWSLARTPGGEPWQFDEETDAACHARAAATLAAALNPSKEPSMPDPTPTCTATIDGPHVLGGGPVQCTREAGHPENHVGPKRGAAGKVLWTDHNAGATPHGASASEEG